MFSFKMVHTRILSRRTPAKVRSNLKLSSYQAGQPAYLCKRNVHFNKKIYMARQLGEASQPAVRLHINRPLPYIVLSLIFYRKQNQKHDPTKKMKNSKPGSNLIHNILTWLWNYISFSERTTDNFKYTPAFQ